MRNGREGNCKESMSLNAKERRSPLHTIIGVNQVVDDWFVVVLVGVCALVAASAWTRGDRGHALTGVEVLFSYNHRP